MAVSYKGNEMSLAEWSRYCNDDIIATETLYKFHEPTKGATTFYTGEAEMLRVAEDGFYVRGKKVEQDDKEAETVYNAFKQWLSWAQLQRN